MGKFETLTKFKQFADFLEKQIKDDTYPPGTRLPSERDFAKQYGLSHMTVNKALSGLVSRGILKRALGNGTYVAEIGKSFSSQTVGFFIPSTMMHPLFYPVLPSFFQKKGYFPVVFNLDTAGHLQEQFKKLFEEKPKAVIIDSLWTDVLEKPPEETKLIFIHHFAWQKKYKASYVLSDYRAGGYLAASQLLKIGKKKVLIISCKIEPYNVADFFYQGCLRALNEKNLRPFAYIDTDAAPEETYRKIFSSSPRPDGIVSLGDFRLLPVLKILRKLSIKVPGEVAVIGYHNTPWAEDYRLTSVSIQPEIIAEKVGEVLKSGEDKEIVVAPKLIFRESCPDREEG